MRILIAALLALAPSCCEPAYAAQAEIWKLTTIVPGLTPTIDNPWEDYTDKECDRIATAKLKMARPGVQYSCVQSVENREIS